MGGSRSGLVDEKVTGSASIRWVESWKAGGGVKVVDEMSDVLLRV